MRRTERRSPVASIAVLMAVAALVLASCGGDDATTRDEESDATTTTATSTTTEATTTTSEPDGVFTGIDGVTSDVSDRSRIVSLTGDITEIIYELGLGDRIVAVDVTTTYPPAAEELEGSGGSVGFGQALNAEAVLRFEPTLVIGDETIEPAETLEQLRDAGIPVAIIEYQTTLDGVEDKILDVATILGVRDEGEALASEVMAEVDAARSEAESYDADPRVMYLYTRGPSLVLVFGDDLPTNAMIEGASAADAGAEIGDGAIPLTPEALVAAAPDVIVLPESGVEGLGGLDRVLEIPGVAQTPAGMAEAFLAYEEAYFFNLGPRVGDALDRFVEDLYAIIGG